MFALTERMLNTFRGRAGFSEGFAVGEGINP